MTGAGPCDYPRDREGTALISEFTEPRPYVKARAALIVVASVAAIVVALMVFRIRVAPVDATPHFGDQEVETQVFVVGDEIDLKLPDGDASQRTVDLRAVSESPRPHPDGNHRCTGLRQSRVRTRWSTP